MELINFNNYNITCVYENLKETFISRDKIKEIYPDSNIIEGPENLIIIDFSDSKLHNYQFQARYDSRRLYVNKQFNQDNDFEESINEFIETTINLDSAIKGKQKIKAYGFNYDGVFALDDKSSAVELVKNKLLKEEEINKKMKNAKIIQFNPEITFDYQDFLLTIKLSPAYEPENFLSFHINSHFNSNQFEKDKLKIDFKKYYDLAFNKIEKLLNE
jgi:hypothetical protein